MVIELILITLGILGLLIASITDLRTREVPDTISIGLIVIGLILRLSNSIITSDWKYFTTALIWLIIFYILGAIMYYTKQWGGGDSKLLMALGVLYATPPLTLNPVTSSVPFPITILFNILLVGSIYGILWSLFLIIKHFKKFKKPFTTSINKTKHLKKITILELILAIIIILLIPELKFLILSLALIIIIYPYLYLAIKIVEQISFYKIVPVKRLTEGDWVSRDVYKNNKLIYSKKNYGIEKKDIQKLIKAKIKSVQIKEGIPFIPAFLIGTLIALFFGNIVLLII